MTFTNKDLKNMIIPLFFEQLLVMLVGIVDTFIVSFVGESAVSGVSLVNSFNTIFIYLFTALASGGAVVISQYIGRKEQEATNRASGQLLMFSIVFSFILMILVLIFNESLLRLLFGRVENSVMQACITYLRISAYSYPALAIYIMQVLHYIALWLKHLQLCIFLLHLILLTVLETASVSLFYMLVSQVLLILH